MPRDISDSVVVITGASSGIGRATARAFAARGASVALAARSEEGLGEVAAECEAAGGRALVVATDVADEEAVQQLARRTAERFGRIDVWVNDAAVMAYGSFEEIPSEVFRQVIETNLFGMVHGARAALPHFRDQCGGVLINVGSLWSRVSAPQVAPYVTSKFGILGFSECLRQNLHDEDDIHVCVVLPIAVDTPIFRHAANYTGRVIRPPAPVVDPERVVRAIVRNAEQPRRATMVGATGHLARWLHTLLPRLYDRLIPYVFHWEGFRSEPAETGTGNVFEAMPGWNRVSGGWRRGGGIRHAVLARARRGAGVGGRPVGGFTGLTRVTPASWPPDPSGGSPDEAEGSDHRQRRTRGGGAALARLAVSARAGRRGRRQRDVRRRPE